MDISEEDQALLRERAELARFSGELQAQLSQCLRRIVFIEVTLEDHEVPLDTELADAPS